MQGFRHLERSFIACQKSTPKNAMLLRHNNLSVLGHVQTPGRGSPDPPFGKLGGKACRKIHFADSICDLNHPSNPLSDP